MKLQPVYIGESSFYIDEPSLGKFKLFDAAKDAVQEITVTKQGVDNFDKITAIITDAGFPSQVIPWATAQAMFESNNLKSHVSQADNNYSGIKFLNKSYQHDATRGTKSPEGDYYAHFSSPTAWAKDFKRIISLKLHGPAAIEAQSLEDYAHRLKVNGYYGAPENLYLIALQRLLQAQPVAKEFIDKNKDTPQTWWGKLPWYGKVSIGVGAAVVLIKVIQR